MNLEFFLKISSSDICHVNFSAEKQLESRMPKLYDGN
jgi:hypothetical protein